MTEKAIIIESKSFDLDKVLKEVGSGFKAVIKRIEPSWCDGHIDTIELDPDEPISMETLRQEYGGRKLQIVIQKPDGDYVTARTVKFPDPPRREGRVLNRYEEEGSRPQSTAAPNMLGEMKSIFELMLNSQERQMTGLTTAMEKRLDSLERGSGQGLGSAGPMKPTDHVKQSLAMIKQIEDLKSEMGFNKAPDQEQENSVTRAIDKFTDLMIEKEQAKIKASIEAQSKQQTSPALPAASTYTPPAEAQSNEPATPADAARTIEGLSDIELAAHVKNRLEKMDPEDREKAFSSFADLFDLEEEEEDDEEDLSGEENSSNIESLGRVKVIQDEDEDLPSDSESASSPSPTP